MISYRSAISAAIASSVLSSLAWVFQGEAVRQLSPLLVASLLNVISAVMLFTFLFWRKTIPRWHELWDQRKDLLLVTCLRPILGGVFFCYALLFTSGIKLMFFTKLEPYFVLFLAWLISRYPVQRRDLSLLAIHIVGALLLAVDSVAGVSTVQAGDLIVVVTVAMIAWAYTPAMRLARNFGALRANMVTMGIAGVALLPAALWTAPAPLLSLPMDGWINLCVSLLLFQVFGLTLWYVSLEVVEGWMVSALRATGPVFAAPFAFLFFGQTLSSIQIFGAALVLGTSAMIALKQQKATEPLSLETHEIE